MKVEGTKLKDVWLITPDVHTDFRGEYAMLYNEKEYQEDHFNWFKPIEHDISTSFRGVLRGIHYSPNCWKLNECLLGTIYYVCVNCDESDPEWGRWEAFILSDRNRQQIFKHPRYGTGFLVLSDFCIFHYMQSQYYDPADPDQETFMYNDPRFNIWWPKLYNGPILSQRDEAGHYIKTEL